MRVAAIGDSVNWGQGLKHPLVWEKLEKEHKYIFQYIEWLQKKGQVGEINREDFLQHSGAIIGDMSHVSKAPLVSRARAYDHSVYDLYYGEIPDDFPTVIGQLKKIKDPKSVGLLFINGGPNDVGVLKSGSFDDAFQKALKDIDRLVSKRLALLLTEARKACPNAIIVYTGYYPALSPESSIPFGTNIAGDLVGVPTLAFLVASPVVLALELLIKTQTTRIKKQGLIFHKRMLGRFREQISEFNEKRDPGTMPIVFCPSGFHGTTAMWTKNEWVSSTDSDPNSDVTHFRKKLCKEVSEKSYGFMDRTICESAYAGHPNKKGADQYFKELVKRIDPQLSFSLRKHLETIDSSVMSTKKLKDKYQFIPISSLRNLTDVLWLDSISISYSFTLKEDASETAAAVAKGGPDLIRFLTTREKNMKSTRVLGLDFGWGFNNILLNDGVTVADLEVIDLKGNRQVSSLKYLHIRFPQDYGTIKFSVRFEIKINGYLFKVISLNEQSFTKQRLTRGWKMNYFNLNQA